MVPAGGAEGFEAGDFGFDVVGFDVQVHALFAGLGVAGLLEQDADLGVREDQAAVDGAAGLGQGFFGGAEGGSPEGGALVQVGDVDDEVADSAAAPAGLMVAGGELALGHGELLQVGADRGLSLAGEQGPGRSPRTCPATR
jgi:hypothetical protein